MNNLKRAQAGINLVITNYPTALIGVYEEEASGIILTLPERCAPPLQLALENYDWEPINEAGTRFFLPTR